MTFEEVRRRVLDLLQRQGWASYRTLKRRFGVDAATLSALKHDLITVRREAIDEEGTRLVWQGELRPLAHLVAPEVASVAAEPLLTVSAPPARAPDLPSPRPRPPSAAPPRRQPKLLVGRDQEMRYLLAQWERARAGHGQVALLTGEAGIGKSHLVEVIKAEVTAHTTHARWECRCAPFYQHSALYPIIDLFQRLTRWQPDETPTAKLHRIETALMPYDVSLEKMVPLLAALMSVPVMAPYTLPALSPERQKQETLAAIVTLLRAVTTHQPVLMIVEDIHWMDASTGELLRALLPHVPTMPLALLLTCRPEFRAPWPRPAYLTSLTLNRLLPSQVASLAESVADGNRLPNLVLEQIVERTEGVPLFIEAVTRMLLESGLLQRRGQSYELIQPLPALAIPDTLRSSLAARLARLGAAQTVAQTGAVWGRGFTEAQIRALTDLDDRHLTQLITHLVRADILQEVSLPPRVTYIFKHALIQEVAYASMSTAMRQACHERAAHILTEDFPGQVATEPELLAYHYTEAGLPAQAIPYWQQAGQYAIERSAHIEAISHLSQGLALLAQTPATPGRLQQELDLCVNLGASWMATKGFAAPEVEQVYARARALCQQLGQTPQLLTVLRGLWTFYDVRGDLTTARQLAEQCFALSPHLSGASQMLWAHYVLGQTMFYQGELALSQTHMEDGMRLYDPRKRRSHRTLTDPGVNCYMYTSWLLWLRGQLAASVQRSRETCTLAQQLDHPFSQAFALYGAAKLYLCRGESAAAQEPAAALIALAREQAFPLWTALGTIVQGGVLALQGQQAAGTAHMCQGLEQYRATGAGLHLPWDLALLAQVYSHGGQVEDGLRTLAEAEAIMARTGERFWEAELHRVRGTLLCQRQTDDDTAAAQQCFRRALHIAQAQQARSLELRAAIDLSQLWQHQGQPQAAQHLLSTTLAWFDGQGHSADLERAQALLGAL